MELGNIDEEFAPTGMPDGSPDATVMYPGGRPEIQIPNIAEGMSNGEDTGMTAPVPSGESLQFSRVSQVLDLGERPSDVLDLGDRPVVKKEPGFLKKLDMINTGVHRGVTHFTHKLMSLLPLGKDYQERIKRADEAVEREQQSNIQTYGSLYPKIGEIGGELLATLPVGGLYGKVTQGAQALGKTLPLGFQTIGKYGASALGGAGVLAGMETQRYDADRPDQLLNTEAAVDALKNPLSYVLPAVGTKLSTWADKSRQLGVAKESVKGIMARDILEPGPIRKVSHQFFDSLPMLTGLGKRAKQIEHIGDDIQRFISKVSGGNEAVLSKDLIKFAGTKVQSALQRIKRGGDQLWNQPFKTKVIADTQGVKDNVLNAIDILKGSGIPLEAKTIKFLNQGMRKGGITVEDVKNLQSIIGDAAINAKNAGAGGIGNRMSKELIDTKNGLLDEIQKSLSPADMKDFMAAREYSARQFQMYKEAPKLQKALESEVASRKLIKDLLSETEMSPKKSVMNIMSPRGQKAVQAAKIAKALEDSDIDGKINLTSFLNKTSEKTQTPEILGNQTYKALQGLNKYLSSVNEASQGNWWKQATLMGGLAAGGSAVAGPSALIAYPVATFIANHSPLKTALHALTKKLPDSTYKYLTQSIENQLVKGGFLMTREGVLQHKDDEE